MIEEIILAHLER
ncbi:hypothetical protein BN3564_40007 [Escherichia coli]|nr:hypothetical protein BN3564_40007 [Escherichia coli]